MKKKIVIRKENTYPARELSRDLSKNPAHCNDGNKAADLIGDIVVEERCPLRPERLHLDLWFLLFDDESANNVK